MTVRFCAGVDCERPKQTNLSDNEVELMSSETPDSTELYMKGSTPPELTPDASPGPSPAHKSRSRPKNARFLRQSAVDDDRGGASEIQVLVEGRSQGRPSGGPDDRPRTNGNAHRHSSSNHKHASSNHRRERWAEWTSRRTHSRLLEQDEEKLSNYEMEMKPLQPMDAQKTYGHGDERHRGKNRLKNREREKVDTGPDVSDPVQKLASLRVTERLEARPLRRDLALSTPQKSTPIALVPDNKNHKQMKANTVSINDTPCRAWRGRTFTPTVCSLVTK